MSDESRRARLEADGLPPPWVLDAWEVPDPSPDLIDRMFEEPTTMHPTPAPRRPLQSAIAIGILVAACLIAAFWLGRQSVTPPPAEAPAPPPPAEAPVAGVECPPPPECPPPSVLSFPVPFPVEDGGTRARAKPRPKPRPEPKAKPSPAVDRKNLVKSATLRLGSRVGSPPADVYVDGVRKGKTPQAGIKVVPGRHVIRFKYPDGREVSRRIVVEAGESLVLRG